MLERFNADVVYSESGESCGGVGVRMSVVFLLCPLEQLPCSTGETTVSEEIQFVLCSCFPCTGISARKRVGASVAYTVDWNTHRQLRNLST